MDPQTPDSLPARISPAAEEIIHGLRMERIPHEGAWFAPAHRSPHQTPDGRDACSSIYALLTDVDFSALHRLNSEEFWIYNAGAPVEVLLLHPDGSGEELVLGPDVLHGQRLHVCIPAGSWMGGRVVADAADRHCLFSCVVVPGFDYEAYEPGERAALQAAYPAWADRIHQFTREA
ncbi:MAG: hypothetical protein E1N59_3135 [Puniceicoccaceae bacterium 5H]|nr:MAG: hypothetical protein E1N59_3135 [Puniceicoccaceae bacterium 5H]